MLIWDAASIGHLALHGIEPAEAEQVLANDPLDLQRQLRHGEQRVLHLGETAAGRIFFVVVALRGAQLRVVTAYPAGKRERRFYETQKRTGGEHAGNA